VPYLRERGGLNPAGGKGEINWAEETEMVQK